MDEIKSSNQGKYNGVSTNTVNSVDKNKPILSWNEHVSIEGKKIIAASTLRLDPKKYPDSYLYSIRHDDDDWDKPCTIEKIVVVNHFGDIILDAPLEKLENKDCKEDYLELSIEDQAAILTWIELWGDVGI